jgi:hypothetical protein
MVRVGSGGLAPRIFTMKMQWLGRPPPGLVWTVRKTQKPPPLYGIEARFSCCPAYTPVRILTDKVTQLVVLPVRYCTYGSRRGTGKSVSLKSLRRVYGCYHFVTSLSDETKGSLLDLSFQVPLFGAKNWPQTAARCSCLIATRYFTAGPSVTPHSYALSPGSYSTP